jgi:deazaflavin-dependent oxidoreductase (nitroreductase family)
MVGRYRRTHKAVTQGGIPAFVVETTGAKTGQPRRILLGHLDEPEGSYLVMASLGGAARNPAWLYNLRARPEATIEYPDGRRLAVRAETLQGEDLERAWKRMAVDAPEYDSYRSKTDRQIAVLRLTPVA